MLLPLSLNIYIRVVVAPGIHVIAVLQPPVIYLSK